MCAPHPRRLTTTILLLGALTAVGGTAQAATPGVVVRDHAERCTPRIAVGEAYRTGAVAEPSTVYVGGTASTVVDCHGRSTFVRRNTLAYDARTGAVRPFVADTDGEVRSLALSRDGSSLFVGGDFTHVNHVPAAALAKVDAITGRVDNAFHSRLEGKVYALQQAPDGRLLVGGTFPQRLLALNPSTGADTGTVRVTITGDLDSTSSTPEKDHAGAGRVDKLALSPSGTDLVVLGNWLSVNGQQRNQAARFTLSPTSATLSPWHPARLEQHCGPTFPYYVRNVAWSQDSSFFVLVATGGGRGTAGFCDSAGRWNATTTSRTYEPVWQNVTGSDSLYSAAVDTAAHAVYVGGHNRWLDNPLGHNDAGPGAFLVNSIGAINTSTGKAIRTFSCVGCTREHGKEWLGLGSFGLVEASDGHLVSNDPHLGTAVFPR